MHEAYESTVDGKKTLHTNWKAVSGAMLQYLLVGS